MIFAIPLLNTHKILARMSIHRPDLRPENIFPVYKVNQDNILIPLSIQKAFLFPDDGYLENENTYKSKLRGNERSRKTRKAVPQTHFHR